MRNLLVTMTALSLMTTMVVGEEIERIHYWNGAHQVWMDLSLGELDVPLADADTDARVSRAVPGTTIARSGRRWTASFVPADRVALQARAAALLSQGRSARAVVYPAGMPRTEEFKQVVTNRLVLRTRPGQDRDALCRRNGIRVIESVAYSPDTIIGEVPGDILAALITANRLVETEGVAFSSPLIEHIPRLRGTPSDALFPSQWHLQNTGQLGGATAGNDINVVPVWDFINNRGLGTGINIAVVDSGAELAHPDLAPNIRTDLDHDFISNDSDASADTSNPGHYHGTAVGGIAAARDGNGLGVGVAPRAGLVPLRLITGVAVSDAVEADAMNWQVSASDPNRVHVSNNSWGVDDDGSTLGAAGVLMQAALQNGVTVGRGGRGVVYVWAAGNGYGNGDNADYDGYANSPYVIAVAASRHDGYYASYSEGGACLFVNAPGGDGGAGMVIPDFTGTAGYSSGSYYSVSDSEAGTSFATPIVAGVVALMLEANPYLTWRDVKHILARTSVQNDPTDPNWITNHASPARHWSYYSGFGRVDALAAITAAKTWLAAPPSAAPVSQSSSSSVAIPDNGSVSQSIVLSAPTNFHAEMIELHVNVSHSSRGQLAFRLTSPSGTMVTIRRRRNDGGSNLDWTFTSVASWGELATGTWTLEVFDLVANTPSIAGTLNSWGITAHGYIPHTAPTLSNVSPSLVAQGASTTSFTVTGSGFVPGSLIRWNGVDQTTTYVSSTQLSATIAGANFSSSGSFPVTVATGGFDGESPVVSSAQNVVVNAPPSITSLSPSPANTNEDTSIPVTVTVTDTDTASTALVFTASSANPAVVTNGNMVFSGSGFTRTLTITPVADASGSAVITVYVFDGYNTATSQVTVNVSPVFNDPPVALGGRFHGSVGTALMGSVAGFDADGDSTTFYSVDLPANGTLSLQTDGHFTYTPGVTISGPFRGIDVFTYRVKTLTNGDQSAPAQVLITIAGDPNGVRPLIVSEPSDEQIPATGNFSYSVLVDTRRYVFAPTLNYELVGAPSGMVIDAITGVISWSTLGAADGHVSFGIVVKDTITGALDTQTVVLRVVGAGASN